MYITPASIILFKYILSFCWLYLLFSASSIHSFPVHSTYSFLLILLTPSLLILSPATFHLLLFILLTSTPHILLLLLLFR